MHHVCYSHISVNLTVRPFSEDTSFVVQGVLLLQLFNLVGAIKFGYACEMVPWVSGGLLLKSKEPFLGSRLFVAAQMIGAGIFGALCGAITHSIARAISMSTMVHPLLIVAVTTITTLPVCFQRPNLADGSQTYLALGYGFVIIRGVGLRSYLAIFLLCTEVLRLALCAALIVSVTAWLVWPSLAGCQMRKEAAALILDLGRIAADNASGLLKARREGKPIQRLSRPISLSHHLHADFGDSRRHRQSEDISAKEDLLSFAVSLSELRPRLVHLEELLPMALMEPPFLRIGLPQYKTDEWLGVLAATRRVATCISSINILVQGNDLQGLSKPLMALLEVNAMPACRLVVGQLAAGLKAIAEGILADKDGQQAHAVLLRSVWSHMEFAIADSLYDFTSAYLEGACGNAQGRTGFKDDPFKEVRPFCFLYTALNAGVTASIDLEDKLARALSVPIERPPTKRAIQPYLEVLQSLPSVQYGSTTRLAIAQMMKDTLENTEDERDDGPQGRGSTAGGDWRAFQDNPLLEASLPGAEKHSTGKPSLALTAQNLQSHYVQPSSSSETTARNLRHVANWIPGPDSSLEKEWRDEQSQPSLIDFQQFWSHFGIRRQAEAASEDHVIINMDVINLDVTSILNDQVDLQLATVETSSSCQNEAPTHVSTLSHREGIPGIAGNIEGLAGGQSGSYHYNHLDSAEDWLKKGPSQLKHAAKEDQPAFKEGRQDHGMGKPLLPEKIGRNFNFSQGSVYNSRPLQRWPNEKFGNNQLIGLDDVDDILGQEVSPPERCLAWLGRQVRWAAEPLWEASGLATIEAVIWIQLSGFAFGIRHPRTTWKDFRRDKQQQYVVKYYIVMITALTLIILLTSYYPPALQWQLQYLYITIAYIIKPKVDTTVGKGVAQCTLTVVGALVAYGILEPDIVYHTPVLFAVLICIISFIASLLGAGVETSQEITHLFFVGFLSQSVCTAAGKTKWHTLMPIISRAGCVCLALVLCISVSLVAPWYLSDAALSGLADSLDGAGLAFEAMSHAWMEELESGHQRGTKWPRWLVERQHGVLNLARDLLQTQVETKTVAVFNDLRSETVIWRRGLLSTPKVVTVSLDLLHDILEALTGLEITIRQKPLTSARFSGGPWKNWQGPLVECTTCVRQAVVQVCRDAATVMRFDCKERDLGFLHESIMQLEKQRAAHQGNLTALMTEYFNENGPTGVPLQEQWSVDDIVRFESHAFAVQKVMDVFLRLAKTIAASEWLRDRMSASIVWRASAVWIGADKL